MAPRVDVEAIQAAWRSDPAPFWLLFADAASSVDAVRAVVESTNYGEYPQWVLGENVAPVPSGVVTLVEAADEDSLSRWLDRLAEGLPALGEQVEVRLTVAAPFPAWFAGGDYVREATAFVALSVDRDLLQRGQFGGPWLLSPSDTEIACRAIASWLEGAGDATTAMWAEFTFDPSDGITLHEVLAQGVVQAHSCWVLRGDDSRRSGRFALLGGPDGATLQVVDEAMDWQERVEVLRAALVDLAPIVDLAFVRPAPRRAGWNNLNDVQPAGAVRESLLRDRRDLLNRYVTDVHGIQVVRDAHLAKAADLSNWSVTNLGSGRHLLEAHDLAAWYAEVVAPDDVVEAGRRDFGEMVITTQTLSS